MDKQLATLDLNLMKLLKAVVETKNTHQAAEILGISQTSVSRGLAKLRETFGEQLFLRKAHGVEPSELAEKLAQAADEMLIPINKVMESYNNFDPLLFTGKVSLSVNTYLLEVFGERLIQTLSAALPKASFELDYWQAHSLADMLSGQIDYSIQLSSFHFPQDIYSHRIKSIKLAIVARKNHPILSQGSDWEILHELPVVQLYLSGVNYNKSALHDMYKSKGYKANVVLKTHSLKAALYTLKNTDSLCYSSSYISELDNDLAIYPMPILPDSVTKSDIIGGYLQTRRGYPLNQFLHQLLQQFFDEIKQS
ncbi:LysR family transcriptional regulator [Moritella dasanensis]|uniref:LysR family transcriptional regulator n=1 Tax=Moritella dasanensis TaxID=428031 RepID=UPI00030768F9|nr:LysR family transcriptional regulator [Moritella dasanensis]